MGLPAASGPVSGWLTVKAPFTLEIREFGRLLGTTDTDRIMMAAGRHDIELVNESLAYRATRAVQVPPGKVAAINLDLPNGFALTSPWAEAGSTESRLGTPIGHLRFAIGPHEGVFRHPQLGENAPISYSGGPVSRVARNDRGGRQVTLDARGGVYPVNESPSIVRC